MELDASSNACRRPCEEINSCFVQPGLSKLPEQANPPSPALISSENVHAKRLSPPISSSSQCLEKSIKQTHTVLISLPPDIISPLFY